MYLSVSEAMNLDTFKSFKLIAGHKGLNNKITKVGVLDFEFTQKGEHHWSEDQFIVGEFVLATFLYAKDNESIIYEGIKRLIQIKSSGLAIKNIFNFKITRQIIHYANVFSYPIFIFTDHSIFFEDCIIEIAYAINKINKHNLNEDIINDIIYKNFDYNYIKKSAKEINYHFKNCFIAMYFNHKGDNEHNREFDFLEVINRVGKVEFKDSIIKHNNGFFYIATFEVLDLSEYRKETKDIINNLSIDLSEFDIGISGAKFFLTDFKKGILESYYASQYNIIVDKPYNFYDDINIYKFILPFINEEWVKDYYLAVLDPIIKYDINCNSELIDTLMKYVESNGNIKSTAEKLFLHENTVRYRINKISELVKIDSSDNEFYLQLSIAINIYRIRQRVIPM